MVAAIDILTYLQAKVPGLTINLGGQPSATWRGSNTQFFLNEINNTEWEMPITNINYYNRKNCCIKIKSSKDGLNWKQLDDIFLERAWILENDKRKNNLVAESVRNSRGIILLVNHNYQQNNSKFASYLVDYRIPEDYLNELL